jgi:hypothetical protein
VWLFFQILCRFVLGVLLLISAAAKVLNWRQFKKVVVGYEIIPRPFAELVASALPIAEILVGLSLCFRLFYPITEYSAAGLFMIFAFAITINLMRKRYDLSCGCLGLGKTISWRLVTRNLGLMGIAFLVADVTRVGLALLIVFGLSTITPLKRPVAAKFDKSDTLSPPLKSLEI